MVNNQKFEETFNKVNSEYSNYFEGTKVKVLEERRKAALIVVAIFIGFFICIIIPFFMIFLFMGILGLVIYGIINSKKTTNKGKNNTFKPSAESTYTTQYKKLVVMPFIKLLTPNIQYLPNKGLPKQAYVDAMFEGFDVYHSDDDIAGYINNYQFEIANVHTEDEHTDSDGHTTYTTVFKGLYAFMPLPGTYEIEMFLRKDIKDSHKILAKMSKKRFDELYTILDSSEFENKFDVYTNNKIFAAKILTHDIMQMMVDFENQYKIPFEFTIRNNYFYIRFPGYDLFEPVIKKDQPALSKEVLYKDYVTLDFIYTIMYTIYENIRKTND